MKDKAGDSVYDDTFYFHDEDTLSLSWYARRVIGSLRTSSVKSLISLGIGRRIVSGSIINEYARNLDKYLIIEGSDSIISQFTSGKGIPSNVEVIHSAFEAYRGDEKVHAIEMGFVLEHVEDPLGLLNHYRQFLETNGLLFIAVPNARSLHRLIGKEAGLLDDLFVLSDYDHQYGHRRYFDFASLSRMVLDAHLKINKAEGILLKPFSTSQLKSLHLPAKVINALCEIGIDYPEICNSIYIEATPLI